MVGCVTLQVHNTVVRNNRLEKQVDFVWLLCCEYLSVVVKLDNNMNEISRSNEITNSKGNVNFGLIKWFGGHNNKTGRENDFGFLQAMSGEEIFIHQNSIATKSAPVENDVFVYEIETRNGKSRAINAHQLENSGTSILAIFNALYFDSQKARPTSSPALHSALVKYLIAGLPQSELAVVRAITDRANNNYIFKLLDGQSGRQDSSGNSTRTRDIFDQLSSQGEVNVFADIPLSLVPQSVILDREEVLAMYLASIGKEQARAKCLEYIEYLPIHLVFFLLIIGVLLTDEDVDSRLHNLKHQIRKMYTEPEVRLPDYVRVAYENYLKPLGGYRHSPVLWKIIESCMFKKYLFEKDPRFISVYEASELLKKSIDSYVLFNIFSLTYSGNDTETTYKIFNQRLWEEMASGGINFLEQHAKILELFPSCGTIGPILSCEAVYWKAQDKYLCRGHVCRHPRVIPNDTRNFLEFTMYDWFAHYGIEYAEVSQPSHRDFPIKLAGYFNRLRQIFPIIHCRACSKLMTPNYKYARTEYQDFENGHIVTKNMSAAYRVTIFRCNEQSCSEYAADYYISHCMGFDCNKIIDSRDLNQRCDSGKYICKGCGSCCETHAKSNPVGLCAQCGGGLKLFEQASENYLGKQLRRVMCEKSCGFCISSKDLSKKFYLPSCQPVYREAST